MVLAPTSCVVTVDAPSGLAAFAAEASARAVSTGAPFPRASSESLSPTRGDVARVSFLTLPDVAASAFAPLLNRQMPSFEPPPQVALSAVSGPSPLVALTEMAEATKAVLFSAFQLRLLGLNARVLATRLGDQARGFGVLSGEWVALGRSLDELMRALDRVNETVIGAVGREQLRRRRWRLLTSCEAVDALPPLSQVRAPSGEVRDARLALRLAVSEALRACTLGLVIARTAKIEAAWSVTARESLGALALDFEGQLGSILPELRKLVNLERRAL